VKYAQLHCGKKTEDVEIITPFYTSFTKSERIFYVDGACPFFFL
jgi:hypothetical protein